MSTITRPRSAIRWPWSRAADAVAVLPLIAGTCGWLEDTCRLCAALIRGIENVDLVRGGVNASRRPDFGSPVCFLRGIYMLRLTELKLPLDHGESELRSAILNGSRSLPRRSTTTGSSAGPGMHARDPPSR